MAEFDEEPLDGPLWSANPPPVTAPTTSDPAPDPAPPQPSADQVPPNKGDELQEVTKQVEQIAIKPADPNAALVAFEKLRGLIDVDGTQLSIQQADPHSPLYSVASFEELAHLPNTTPIPEGLLKGIRDLGFTKPSKIQETALPLLLKIKGPQEAHPANMIFQSQAGTGKTAAFAINLLSRVDPSLKHPQAIVVSPTFNLCMQLAKVIGRFAKFMPEVQITVHYSNVPPLLKDGEKIKEQVLVITPGELVKYTNVPARAPFDMRKVGVVVFDEADHLIDEGFIEDMKRISKRIPPQAQIVLSSATFEPYIMETALKLVPAPVNKLLLPQQEISLTNVSQFYAFVDGDRGKHHAVELLYDNVSLGQTLIFVERRDAAEQLAKDLNATGHDVAVLHGKMEKGSQDAILNRFRKGKEKVLITTNALARGIDVEKVSLVVNYDLPLKVLNPHNMLDSKNKPDFDTYLHRIGRTGRFGKKGSAISLIDKRSPIDLQRIKEIEARWKNPINELNLIDTKSLSKNVVCE